MEFNLKNLVDTATLLSEEDLLVVATHKVSFDHGLWGTHLLKEVAVQAGLHYAVIKLDQQHELLMSSHCLLNQLARLNFVIVEALLVFGMIITVILIDGLAIGLLCRNDADITAENVDSLLADLLVCITFLIEFSWLSQSTFHRCLLLKADNL